MEEKKETIRSISFIGTHISEAMANDLIDRTNKEFKHFVPEINKEDGKVIISTANGMNFAIDFENISAELKSKLYIHMENWKR